MKKVNILIRNILEIDVDLFENFVQKILLLKEKKVA